MRAEVKKENPQMMLNEKKERFLWGDIGKGIGIILVMAGHSKISSLPYVQNWIWSFHLPIFFFFSGVFTSPEKIANSKKCLLDKFFHLMYPYCMLSLVNLCIIFLLNPCYDIFVCFVRNFFSFDGPYQPSALWFLPVLWETWVVFLIYKKIPSIGFYLALLLSGVSAWLLCKYEIMLPMHIDSALSSVVFLGAGFICSNTLIQKLSQNSYLQLTLLLVLFCTCHLVGTIFCRSALDLRSNTIINPLCMYLKAFLGIGMIVSVSRLLEISPLCRRPAKILAFLGRHSLEFLAIHQLGHFFFDTMKNLFPQYSPISLKIAEYLFLAVLATILIRYGQWLCHIPSLWHNKIKYFLF